MSTPATAGGPTGAPAREEEPRVACPQCGSAQELQEFAIRLTYQPVMGLRRDGNADDWGTWEACDDEVVTGYGCRGCGWEVDTAPTAAMYRRLVKGAEKALAAMKVIA